MNKYGMNEQRMVNMWARRMMEEANRASAFAQFLAPRLPLTRMQKLRNRLSMYGDRLRNAWNALRGIDND